MPGRVPQDADPESPEVPDAAIRLRHAERSQVEVRPVCERHTGITGVSDEQRFTRQLAAAGGRHPRRSPSVRLGFVLAMPGIVRLAVGCDRLAAQQPRDAGDLPVAQQLLDDPHAGEGGHVVAVVCGDVVPTIVGCRSPVPRANGRLTTEFVGIRVVALVEPTPFASVYARPICNPLFRRRCTCIWSALSSSVFGIEIGRVHIDRAHAGVHATW